MSLPDLERLRSRRTTQCPASGRMLPSVLRVCLAALLVATAGCKDDSPFGPNYGQVVPYDSLRGGLRTLRVLQGGAPPSAPILSVVPRLYEIVLTDSTGRRISGATISFGKATGFIRADSAGDAGWRSTRDASLITGSDGHLRFRWYTGTEATQRLVLEHGDPQYTNGTSLDTIATLSGTGSVTPVTAEQVAPSGIASTCVLQAGRLGCLGAVARASEANWAISPSLAVQTPRWLETASPVVSVRSVLEGACALLADGTTSCWQGLGPDGPLPVSSGHPPFVELAGRLARAADSSVWMLTWPGTRAAPTWRAIGSDSVIARLLVSGTALGGCGLAAGGTVLCGVRPESQPTRDNRMVVVRDGAGGPAVTANSGYAMEEVNWGEGGGFRQLAVVLDSGTTGSRYLRLVYDGSNPDLRSLGSATRPARSSGDVPVSGDGSTRSCVRLLSAECSTDVWSSHAAFGLLRRPTVPSSRTPFNPEYFRVCGIRRVIVCYAAVNASTGVRDTLVVPLR